MNSKLTDTLKAGAVAGAIREAIDSPDDVHTRLRRVQEILNDAAPKRITQYAPWPDELQWLVEHLHFKGLAIQLHKNIVRDRQKVERPTHWSMGEPLAGGTTLQVTLTGVEDSYHPGEKRPPTVFYWIVPAATFDRESWLEWLLDQVHQLSQHEDFEHFQIIHDDGTIERPFAPLHGPGNDPNRRHQWIPDLLERRRTSFTGEIKEEE